MEPFYYKEKYKSLSLVPGRSLGAQRGSGADQGPCEQWEELQGLHIPLAGKRFTTWSRAGAGRSPWGLTLAPRGARCPGAAWLEGTELLVEAAGFGHCAFLRVCDLFKFPSEAFQLLWSSSASVSAQECGPVWLSVGQMDRDLGLRVLRAHIQKYCKK